MFSSGPNYTKLKTNLRLALNRLKLLEKKKAELAQKSRKEIADYLGTGKIERARIRVEHIIREDYLVEAMEIIEMYCDLLLARFGLITQMKDLDDGIAEAVSSLVWVCPRLQSDVDELKVIADIFISKYGPQFAELSRTATGEHHVSEKLMHKLQLQAPPKLLVEKYLIEIAKNYNIEYEPDPQVMKDDHTDGQNQQQYLIDLSDRNNLGGGGGGGGGAAAPPQMGFIGYPGVPPLPTMPEPPSSKPFNYPPPFSGGGGGSGAGTIGSNSKPFNYPPPFNGGADSGGARGMVAGSSSGVHSPFAYNIPPTVQPGPPPPSYPNDKKDLNTNFINDESYNFTAKSTSASADDSPDENLLRAKTHNDPPPRYSSINSFNLQNNDKPKPQPRSKFSSSTGPSAPPAYPELPSLPNVPNELPDISTDDTKPDNQSDDIDFDDLSRRFENLKKRK